MLFNSPEFLFLFLPIVFLGFFIIGKWGRHRGLAIAWLTCTSLFFYAWWNPVYIGLLLISIAFNYVAGISICRKRGQSRHMARAILIFGITTDLCILAYYKYANFFIDNLNIVTDGAFHLDTILLPLGISFFTFTQIAFLVDAYKGEASEYSLLHYCLFVTYFPHLIAGPILHHREMMSQFAKPEIYNFSKQNVVAGVLIFLIGLIKKVVLADGFATYAGPVFNSADKGGVISFFDGWGGALAYTFQLYFDFSGYSDMAIGSALIFGIHFPLNFNSPYKASNIIEFWRRWHITLSRFLREYLYIPLGGNKKGRVRKYSNLLITMLIGGLWHGAGWTFVIWGGLHGLFLVINHAWRALLKTLWGDTYEVSILHEIVGTFFTFSCVVVAWVFFRANSVEGAFNVLKGMAGINGVVLPSQIVSIVPSLSHWVTPVGQMALLGNGTVMGVFEQACFLVVGFVLCWMCPASHTMSWRSQFAAIVLGFGFAIQMVLFSRQPTEFLYFQF